MIECGYKIKEEVKAIQSEIKKNIQGANSEGKETKAQLKDLEQKKEITFNQNTKKKQALKKMRRGLGTPGQLQTFQHPNHRGARRRRARARN